VNFAAEAYKHGKAVGAFRYGPGLLQRAQIPLTAASADPALVTYDDWTAAFTDDFVAALAATATSTASVRRPGVALRRPSGPASPFRAG